MNKKYEIGALILRLITGFTFFLHGLSKFQGGIENTVGFFSSVGIPGFLAYIVAIIELAGGALMILGLGTRIIGVLFAVVMLGAIFTVKLSAGFMGTDGGAGYEFDVALLAMSVSLALSGSSMLSLDRLFRAKQQEDLSEKLS
ncbi:oxidoreductase [Bacillus glycinifermentans]|uniref:DoxX family protein n=1 Tax=Bacillus glycinifermentans TaxID=1664069 RepID=A0A0J6DWN6_9BACI|nr:DoxX family protein [Bacillus glycinifermentans]ATH94761.1 DoxX family protein [Bacillus glycinifermentans]KMM52886.1 oxidoreductase [Bacillus glycinifermentans]KRT92044.1 oxidoreductase [Bacillus glycinifermentans]MEC0486491.1 DoxX family protein [Bacillus glycinifermentans]MEC0494140.1 DoxX family protein [Bacillus glycinifermentans]